MPQKTLIDAIYQEKARNDSNSRDLAKSLSILSKTVFGRVNRFVFELLQNADDAPKQGDPQGLHVKFELFENHLLFTHTGQHFTAEDVRGISSVGSGESKKGENSEKTGYKGIGFKSVFGTSDWVHIVSGGYSFRFDRNYHLWKQSENYPWQVIPIWTDSLPSEINGKVDTRFVNTIIGISDKKRIREEILQVLDDCQIALFLRNVQSIRFVDGNQVVLHIERKNLGSDTFGLYKNGILVSQWMIYHHKPIVTPLLSEKLQLLSNSECPAKLKQATVTELTFAARTENGSLLPIKDALFYSYLPTNVSHSLPFIVNGDFITNAERTQFLINDWNRFLFESIGEGLISWLNKLHQTPFRFQTAMLFKKPYPYPNELEKYYNKGLIHGVKTIPFLPETGSDQILKAEESIIDSTGITAILNHKAICDYLKTRRRFVDVRLQQAESTIDVGANLFGPKEMCEMINSDYFSLNNGNSLKTSAALIEFFYTATTSGRNSSWLPMLQDTKFLLNETDRLCLCKDLYLPDTTIDVRIEGFTSLTYLHPKVYESISGKEEIILWLSQMGVRKALPVEVVRKSIFDAIDQGKVTDGNTISILRFVFNVFKTRELNDNDYRILEKIPVITSCGLKPANKSYLADIYNPDLSLSQIAPSINFISGDYMEEQDQASQWKDFLIRIGVQQNLSLFVISKKTERKQFILENTWANDYFEWLDAGKYPSIYVSYRNSGQHSIKDFVSINLIEGLTNYGLSKKFWTTVFNNWDKFHATCKETQYFYYGGSSFVPSYIEYYVKGNSCFPATDGKCYKSTELFIPDLQEVVGGKYPVAEIDSYVKREHIEFFGFKRRIAIKDCLDILSQLENRPIDTTSKKQILAIYEQLTKSVADRDVNDDLAINSWLRTGKVLALNNTFQHISTMHCFSVNNIEASANSDKFVRLPESFTPKEIKLFGEVLKIPVVTFENLQFVPTGIKQVNVLRGKLFIACLYLTQIIAHKKSEKRQELYQRLVSILEATIFYKCDTLSLVYYDQSGNEIFATNIESWHDLSGRFFYRGSWSSPLTLYSLTDSLCSLLKIENVERELALFLQLSVQEIISWMLEKGYSVEGIETQSQLHVSVEEPVTAYESQEEEIESENIDSEKIDSFSPQISAKDIDVERIIERKNNITAVETTSDNIRDETPDHVKIDIGRWSEECINNYLKARLNSSAELFWANEKEESYLPYDFKITENGLVRYIEVKGTPLQKRELFLSAREWEFMFDQGEMYSIYRLFNAGKDSVVIETVDNPAMLIKKAQILRFPISLCI